MQVPAFEHASVRTSWHMVVPETEGRYGGPLTTTLGPPMTIVLFVAASTKVVPEIRTDRGAGFAAVAIAAIHVHVNVAVNTNSVGPFMMVGCVAIGSGGHSKKF